MSSHSSSRSVTASILLVDDNHLGLAARKTVLEELGHRIATASGAEQALDQFGRHKFDLLITDYKMPRMNGIDLIQRVRKLHPGLPIILVSGYVDCLGLTETSTGADVVIPKSANEVTHLVRSVERLLGRAAPRKGPSAQRPGSVKRRTG